MPIELRNTDDQPKETNDALNTILHTLHGADSETALSILLTASAAVMSQMDPHHQLSASLGFAEFGAVMTQRTMAMVTEGEEDGPADNQG